MTKATAKPSTKSSKTAAAKAASDAAPTVKTAPAKTAASNKTAASKPSVKVATSPTGPLTAKKTTLPPSEKTSSAPSTKKSAPAPAQASPEMAEAAVSAKSVAPGRSPSKISTQDNMLTTATKVDSKLANAWKTKAGKDLTDAELMAMPDSEYMSDKQLDFFRARLTVLKDDLLSNAGETTEHLREDTSIVPDPADRATIEEEHALELRTRDRERKLLKKISQALARIESGEYGYCDETGEPIGLGRLIARSTATLSLEAQQRRELKQKMFGD